MIYATIVILALAIVALAFAVILLGIALRIVEFKQARLSSDTERIKTAAYRCLDQIEMLKHKSETL